MFGLFKSQLPALTGKTTLMRLPEKNDFTAWAELRAQSRAELKRFEPKSAALELGRRAFNANVKLAKVLAKNHEAFHFLIFKTPVGSAEAPLLGAITLGNIRHGAAKTGEIGYWLGTQHTGKGYMRDAVRTVLAYSFSSLHLHRVEAACIQSNNRSLALLQHCGFQYEGCARSYLEIDGLRQDHHLYACLTSDILTLRP